MSPLVTLHLGAPPLTVNQRGESRGATIGRKRHAREKVSLAWMRFVSECATEEREIPQQVEGERWVLRVTWRSPSPPRDAPNLWRTVKPYEDACRQLVRRRPRGFPEAITVDGEAPLLIDDDDAHLFRAEPITERSREPALIFEFWRESDWRREEAPCS